MAKVHISFTLDSEKDKRLLRWLEGLDRGQKSAAIREALTTHLGQNGITLRDIYEAIQELRQSGVVVVEQERVSAHDDDPALTEALENLSKLGL